MEVGTMILNEETYNRLIQNLQKQDEEIKLYEVEYERMVKFTDKTFDKDLINLFYYDVKFHKIDTLAEAHLFFSLHSYFELVDRYSDVYKIELINDKIIDYINKHSV